MSAIAGPIPPPASSDGATTVGVATEFDDLAVRRANQGKVMSRCWVRSRIARTVAIARNFSAIQAIAPGDDIAHRDGDRGHHQKRLDNQEGHEENEQHERRRQPIYERDKRPLEPRPRYEADQQAADRDEAVPDPGERPGRPWPARRAPFASPFVLHPTRYPDPQQPRVHKRVTLPINRGKRKAFCAAIWPLMRR